MEANFESVEDMSADVVPDSEKRQVIERELAEEELKLATLNKQAERKRS